MNTYITLLKSINVGGRNSLTMEELVSILEGLGCQRVRTYIQSGNAVFEREEEDPALLSRHVKREIENRCGFAPDVLLLTLAEFLAAIERNPFSEAESAPSIVHLGFLASVPENPDVERLESLSKESERFRIIENVFYLHAPEGIGRSTLARKAEKRIGVTMTMRNRRTVGKIKEMAEGL